MDEGFPVLDFFFFVLQHLAFRVLVPRPGIKPMPSAWSQPLDHQVGPWIICFLIKLLCIRL